jgi:hypothetical protein
MAINDITFLDEAQFGEIGSQYYLVKANESTQGTGSSYTPAFRAGEPVTKTLGSNYVHLFAAIATGSALLPVVSTNFLAGIAISGQGGGCSTETASADGYVYVANLVPNVVYLGIANSATLWNTQAKYNALVGARVLMDMSSANPPVYTVLATDGASNGLVVEYIDITKYPGHVAFKLRNALSYSA